MNGSFWKMERVRLLSPERDWHDIAYPPPRVEHLYSFTQDGHRFDVWLEWNGCAMIECEGHIVLRMWAPAAEILKGIEHRRQARAAGR